MKKFWEKYKAAIIAFLLALIGAEGADFIQTGQSAISDPNASETLKTPDTENPESWVTVFELSFYAKQRGTPDNIRVEDTFKADKLPPLEDVMKGAAVPEGYEVNETLPIFIKEIRRERKVINEPPGELPEDVPEKLPTDEE